MNNDTNSNMNKCCCQDKSCQEKGNDAIKESRKIFPEDILRFIDKCLEEEKPASQLIAVLHKVQNHFGYLSPKVMDAVAYLMQIPAAKVSGVASFYHYFRLKPCGKIVISICLGTACYVKGAEALLDKFKEELGIEEGETTSDGLFTLEIARCLGACALAPVVKIGDDVHSQMTPDQVPAVIEHYMAQLSKVV